MIYDIHEDVVTRSFGLPLRVPANVILEIRYDIEYRLFIIQGRKEINGMKIKLPATLVVTLCLAVVGISALTALAQEVPRIAKEELKEMLGNPDVIIIDLRLGQDWENSELRIEGALKEDPGNLNSWLSKFPKEKTLVLYCA